MSNTAVGQLIEGALEAMGYGAQSRTADAMGVRQPTVGKWARGEVRPTPEKWAQLELVLNLKPGSIAGAVTMDEPVSVEDLNEEIAKLNDRVESMARQLEKLLDSMGDV